MAAISAVLNVASQEQVECADQQIEMDDFLKVASGDAVEFEYINCTTDEMANYVAMAHKGDQFARFFLDSSWVEVM